jgi:alpha-tubulin suppressor-like RCC1 family protein
VVTAISAGEDHNCALLATGGIKCWGKNGNGQLGDGTYTSRSVPVPVSGLVGGVTAVTVGGSATCAVTTGGAARCWGDNQFGQLGDGTTSDRNTPVDVNGLASGVMAIGVGWHHACALLAGGTARCWGDNQYGQLGDDTAATMSGPTPPVDVNGLAGGATAIVAGGFHTCASVTGGGLQCWGQNGNGQLGNSLAIRRLAPVDVNGLTGGVTAISTNGDHTCALMGAGGVKCWGYNDSGQLGDGTDLDRHMPVDVSGPAGGVTAIAAGGGHTCAISTGGGVWCWGRNVHGQLGDGTWVGRLTPVAVSGLTGGVKGISAGGWAHTCALTAGGGVQCWGSDYFGQLGDGAADERNTPADVSGLTDGVMAISAGVGHTCALTTQGGVKCWGYNGSGQLGDGTTYGRSTPVDVNGLAGVTAISAGHGHTCALTASGGVKCWGNNFEGELGNGSTTDSLTPVPVNGLAGGVTAVSAGTYHTCALLAGGGVKCWGWNRDGQLGDGTTTDRLTPTNVSGLAGRVRAIEVGSMHTCALIVGGAVKCWGFNDHGQLGVNPGWSPVDVVGFGAAVHSLVYLPLAKHAQ